MAEGGAPPPLIQPTELQDKAVEACRKRVEAALEGEYLVEPLEADLEWDPVSHRHVYDQPMVVWRAYGAFEVILDAQDRPVGFLDEDKWLRCAWRDLPEAEAVALARASQMVPANLALVGRSRGEKDCLELVFGEKEGSRDGVRVRINPVRKAVISVVPFAEDGP